jgi:transcriptional regulator with XRE-family HTH domain
MTVITKIREVRRARGMTLDDVARACEPPTTPQTIGRLETGTRTVSVGWLNRIANALGVDAADLVESGGEKMDVPVAAIVGASGANAPRRTAIVVPPRPKTGNVAVTISASIGDYRAGDEVWCDTLHPEEFGRALNRDVQVPRPAGRFLFGRLLGREEPHQGEASGKLHLLPLGSGMRQQVVANAPWIAMATKLMRSL